MQRESTFDLFIQCLNVTNASLEANRDTMILKPMLAACEAEFAGEDYGVAIYEVDPECPVDFFTIRLQDGVFVLVSHDSPEHDVATWLVSQDYLRDVIAHPCKYVDSPSFLSFEWLKQRLDLTA